MYSTLEDKIGGGKKKDNIDNIDNIDNKDEN